MSVPFVRYPQPATLKKYGLSREDFAQMWFRQEGRCAICENPLTGRMNIDHEHVRGWKKMRPEKRKLYVRGVLCWTCNRLIVGRGVNQYRLGRAFQYLSEYHLRQVNLTKERLQSVEVSSTDQQQDNKDSASDQQDNPVHQV